MLEGKNGLIFGVANKRSMAWAIAQACAKGGASLGFNYLDERLEDKVRELAKTLPMELARKSERVGDVTRPEDASPPCWKCDASKDDELDDFFKKAAERFGGRPDFVVPCIAYSHP